jgi:hypothetical protein
LVASHGLRRKKRRKRAEKLINREPKERKVWAQSQ